jgi:peptidoglycan hydrolase-like protein with peptidoglycan-binding domain
MRIYRYSDFLMVLEQNQISNVGMIGDSHVPIYKKLIPELKTFGEGTSTPLNVGGWNSKNLADGLTKYKESHPEINLIFIKIGDNDGGYNVNFVKKNIPDIKQQLTRIFPNAKFVVVKGSWGWGGLSKFTGNTEPKELVEYYKLWEQQGFEVTNLSQGFVPTDKEAHTAHAGFKSQAEEMKKIMQDMGDIEVFGEASPPSTGEPNVETIQNLEGYYGTLQNSINSKKTFNQQSPGNYEYSAEVEAIQVGLEFLGFELPQYGSDGYYGPETAESISNFKNVYNIDTPENVFSPEDTLVLLNALKGENFGQKDLENVWKQSYKMSAKSLSDAEGVSGGDMDFIFYLAHQQGQAGVIGLINAYLGIGELHPETKRKKGKYGIAANLVANAPSQKEAIQDAVYRGDDQSAAKLFLEYQQKIWREKSKSALSLINEPKNSDVKKAIDSVDTKLPKEFIYKVCFIESGFKPNAGNDTYKGLFAMSEEGFNSYMKEKYPNEKPNIFDVSQNTRAGIANLEKGVSYIINKVGSENLAKLGITSAPTVA